MDAEGTRVMCIDPPEITEVGLLQHLDGEAGPAVAAHLARCPHCAARAGRLRRAEAVLRDAHFRAACPPPLALGEYRMGLLDTAEAVAVTRHLAECPHCSRELALLGAFLAEGARVAAASPIPGAAERVRVLLARLAGGITGALSGALTGAQLAPAYALGGVRGEGASPAVFEAEGASVVLAAHPGASGMFDLLGLLAGPPPQGFSATLWQSGAIVAAAPVDEAGNFLLAGAAAGAAELLLSGPERLIYIDGLMV
jgi:anti-sigma factor RsiW